MKRVLVLTPWWPTEDKPNFGIFVQEHVRALAAYAEDSGGVEIRVLALLNLKGPSWTPQAALTIRECGSYHVHQLERRSRWQPVFYRLASLAKMDWQALLSSLPTGYEPDAIWMNVCYPSALAWHVMPRHWQEKPSLLIEHWTGAGAFLQAGFAKKILPTYLKKLRTVAFVSQTFKQEVTALYPIAHQIVLGNVIDTQLFCPQAVSKQAPSQPLVMLSVMELGANKAPELVLEALLAMAPATRAQFQWWVVGEGAKKAALMRKADEAGIAMVWLERRDKKGIAALMQEVDVLVHPAYVETFGVVVAEGISSGLRVLASQLPVLEELAGEGRGYLVPNEAAAWKNTLLQCLEDKQKGIGHSGLITLAQRHSHHQWIAERYALKTMGGSIATALATDTSLL